MGVLIDCTGLHADPLLTGIQRVTREMLRHWPQHDMELCAVRFDPARGLVAIDPPSLALLLDESARDQAALRQELQERAVHARPVPDNAVVVIPEVFFDPARAWFHRERLRRNPNAAALLSYDFIPWLQPNLFPLHTVVSLMPYLRLVRDARHVAFISERTRRDYATRILRRPDHREGPVLPLGADGLRMERQSWSTSRQGFVALGSIDGRKNQHQIVEAFEALWRNGSDARLTLLGRVFEGTDRAWLDRVMHDWRFRWIDHPSQETVAAVLREARATIYVSAAEGFGLPPVESLHVGIPVIATADMPSLEGVAPGACIRLPAAEPALIADAVSALEDDHRAEAMWQDASAVNLPTWRDFGGAMALWAVGIARAAEQPGEAAAWRGQLGGVDVDRVCERYPQRPAWTRRPFPVTPPSREPVPGREIVLEPRRSLVRRVAGRALRSFRPLAAPLLHRLDIRLRWAVDRTVTAETVYRLAQAGRERQDAAEARLDRLQAEIVLAIEPLEASLARLEKRLEAGQSATQAELTQQRGTIARLVQDRSTAQALGYLIQRTDLLLQQRSLPLGTDIALRTDYGYLLVPLEDEKLSAAMAETAGQLNPGTLSVLLSLLRPGDLMLDVGANIGTLCLPAARQVGARGRVVALEPIPRTAAVLRRSLSLNGLSDRVEVLQCAAGETEGVSRFSISSATTHNSLLSLEKADQIDVLIRPLDACVPAGQPVNVVKLDVEGAKLQAWRGMSRIIAESPDLAVIIEFSPPHLERWGVTLADWLGTMRAPGFTVWEIDEASGTVQPLRNQGLADVYSLNLLLLRQPPSSRPRLRVA